MTRASHQRIAARAARHEASVFAMPPPGMLSEQIDLVDYELVLGLIHPEGSPMLVMIWDGKRFRRLLPDQVERYAAELEAGGHAAEYAPVIAAMRKLVRRVGEIVSAAIMRRSELATMDVEGHA